MGRKGAAVNTNDILAFLKSCGLPVDWAAEADGQPMRCTTRYGRALALSVDAAVILPDVHLGVGEGDAFQEEDPTRTARLERFLGVLEQLRNSLGGEKFAAVQLGDFYDLLRAGDPTASFESRLGTVQVVYPRIASLGFSLPLLHCIGNHDHELFEHRTDLARLGINAHIARHLGDGVLALHGNDLVSLADIELNTDVQLWLLSLVQSLVTLPVIGGLADFLQRYYDDSLADPALADHVSLPWPSAASGKVVMPTDWSAPWVLRDSAMQLGVPLLGWAKAAQRDVQLAIVGHSHRPGISWTEVAAGQLIPLVDVGSWTYGRSTFGVLGSDGIGIAEFKS